MRFALLISISLAALVVTVVAPWPYYGIAALVGMGACAIGYIWP